MTEVEAQIFGKLSALEYVVEIMLANELARQKPEVVEEFSRDFVKDGWFRSGPVAVDHLQAIEAETKATLEEFVAKVVARQAGMREELSRDL